MIHAPLNEADIHRKASCWKIDHFARMTENLQLASDGHSGVHTFHEHIDAACWGSLVGGTSILPSFEELEPNEMICQTILPEITNCC